MLSWCPRPAEQHGGRHAVAPIPNLIVSLTSTLTQTLTLTLTLTLTQRRRTVHAGRPGARQAARHRKVPQRQRRAVLQIAGPLRPLLQGTQIKALQLTHGS